MTAAHDDDFLVSPSEGVVTDLVNGGPITDANLGPILVYGVPPRCHEDEIREQELRQRLVADLNELVHRFPASESMIRTELAWVQKRIGGFEYNNNWFKRLKAVAGGSAFKAELIADIESNPHWPKLIVDYDGNYSDHFLRMTYLFAQLGIVKEEYSGESDPDGVLRLGLTTGCDQLLRIALHVATGIGFRVTRSTNAQIDNVKTKLSPAIRPRGEKERALELLQSLSANAPIPFSEWIERIADTQPTSKSISARKKLARTYARRLIDDGAVYRDEDSLVSAQQ